MKTINKIDVHHHIFPCEYLDALKEAGMEESFGVKLPKWNPAISLKKMKENGIKVAMLSISTPGVYPPGIDLSQGYPEKLARICNEIVADTKKQYPESFGGFATIPLLNQQASIDELNYAMDTLQLDGVCLMSNYMGKYLGDSSFDAFFQKLNKRKAIVMRMLYDFLAKGEPAKGLQLLRNKYYDTTHVSGSYAMKTLQSFAGPDHIVFGSDLCISKLAGIVSKNITKDGEFSEEEFNKMAYGNCLKLFPALETQFRA